MISRVSDADVLERWRELEDTRLRAGSKTRQRLARAQKLRDTIGRDGRVIEMSDIIDAWVRNPNKKYTFP